ncbi:MAG: hypothetical protein U9Q83_08790, partial [Bacteroidota bacterium]|nr:hypothetical protein [Bacteroidota bacterium]
NIEIIENLANIYLKVGTIFNTRSRLFKANFYFKKSATEFARLHKLSGLDKYLKLHEKAKQFSLLLKKQLKLFPIVFILNTFILLKLKIKFRNAYR